MVQPQPIDISVIYGLWVQHGRPQCEVMYNYEMRQCKTCKSTDPVSMSNSDNGPPLGQPCLKGDGRFNYII